MGRRTLMIALSLVWAGCLAASSVGCCCPRRCGGCGAAMAGYVGNAQGAGAADCDRYSARPYHHVGCCRPRRVPRIPGPRSISTLPPPESAAPSFFQPVPTYPVFGPRSEEPDGIEPVLQPLSPDDLPGMEDEPLPAPARNGAMSNDDSADQDISAGEATDLKLAAPQQLIKRAGWKPAKKQSPQAETPTRPCAKCTVTFRSPSSQSR
jgi:hypothetical protein